MNLNRLRRLAGQSTHKRNMHASILLKGGRVLGYGYNTEKAHAEIMAIRRSRWTGHTCSSSQLVSIMFRRRNGSLGISKPCPTCMASIREQGIRSIIYFNGNDFVTETL